MSVIFLLITASSLVAGLFLAAFLWAVRTGQYDDDRSPAVRMLHDRSPSTPELNSTSISPSRKDLNETM